ncbi:MAG: hypothetical protein ACR2QF_18470 [Geminicoccaceae bacterium]
MTKQITTWLHRSGMIKRPNAPGLLFYGSDKAAFEAIAPVLEQIPKTDHRVEIFLCASDAKLGQWLERTFPDIRSVPSPFDFGVAAMMFARRLRIRTAIFLEQKSVPNKAFQACLAKRSIPTVLMSGRGVARLTPWASSGVVADLLIAFDQETDVQTPMPGRLVVIPAPDGQIDHAAAKAALDQLIPLSGLNRKWMNRQDRPLRRMFARWVHRRLDDPIFARRCHRFLKRYHDLDRIRDRLGNPETILCLGNGPSSEDPRLDDVAFDALFRVNHSWKQRSVLTDPDVVFTGGSSTMRALNPPIFGLQDKTGELLLLSVKGPWAFRHCLSYFSMERLGSYLDDFDWGQYRPTNGAAMIAMAVALNPKRLIIAGVDLFRHPEGSYPGDKKTPNAYTPAHSSDKELAFMFHHLDRFTGEIVIFGEILDREWRRHLEQPQHLDEAG